MNSREIIRKKYVAVVHKDRNSEYGVSFPDFPGCISAGKDLDEVFEMAQEAFQFHIDGMVEEGLEIPDAMPMEKIKKNNRDAEAFILLPIVIPRSMAERINITVPQYVLSKIDGYARSHNETRSGLFSKAALSYVKERRAPYGNE
ncbi:MAG: type II toxin-antitoxin system HicB family antitoxin [Victivallales bacterium]